jgi:small subunit ribosomal protein S18
MRNQKPPRRKRNLLQRENVVTVDYKDTTLLRKFLSDRGKIRARRVTGLTAQEQREVARAIKNAREMALLPYPPHTQH